jgi:hypothetical protein
MLFETHLSPLYSKLSRSLNIFKRTSKGMDVSLSKENTSLQVIRILRAEKGDRVKSLKEEGCGKLLEETAIKFTAPPENH